MFIPQPFYLTRRLKVVAVHILLRLLTIGQFFGDHFPQIVAANQTKFFVRNKSDTTEILFSWATSCVSPAYQSFNFLAGINQPLQEIDLLGRAASGLYHVLINIVHIISIDPYNFLHFKWLT